jgi:SAM-dependent methyltransferase
MFVTPMPDEATLSLMYSPRYLQESHRADAQPQRRKYDPVLEILRETGPGRLLDYGCGHGTLLEQAVGVGWSAQGVEFDPEVAGAVTSRTGCPVVTPEALGAMPPHTVDLLHLGDVLEHLTNPDRDMRRLLHLVRSNGLVVAQGPLEAQPSLFVLALRVGRFLRRAGVATTPPYHVSLATAAGQMAFFNRTGLQQETFHVSEVAWPAPERFTRRVLASPRLSSLYAVRRASQLVSKLSSGPSGNRYLYVGRLA